MNVSAVKNKTLLGAFLALFAFANLGPLSAFAAERPNIVFFVLDDFGWGDASYTPNHVHEVPTPNIDALTERGMRFSNAYTQPHCSPSRAAIQTGRHPARGSINITSWISDPPQGGNRVQEWEGLDLPEYVVYLPFDEPTAGERFKELGYKTVHVGKWHLGDMREGYGPPDRGYDVLIGSRGAASPNTYIAPFGIPTLRDAPDGASLPQVLTERTIEFIEQARKDDQPFFISFEHFSVHTPLEALEETIEMYRDEDRTEREITYHAMIHELDQSVGTLLEYFDEHNLFEDTLFVFYSEDGGVEAWADNGGLRGGKKSLWEGGVRVPAAFIWEGRIEPGTTSDVPIIDIDLLPTAFEAAGAPLPDNKPFDGVSILPVLEQRGETDRDAIIFHHPRVTFSGTWMGARGTQVPASAIRMGNHKLYYFYQDDLDMWLYDLEQDPGEQNDIAANHPDVADRMKRRMFEYLVEIDAALPEPNNVSRYLQEWRE